MKKYVYPNNIKNHNLSSGRFILPDMTAWTNFISSYGQSLISEQDMELLIAYAEHRLDNKESRQLRYRLAEEESLRKALSELIISTRGTEYEKILQDSYTKDSSTFLQELLSRCKFFFSTVYQYTLSIFKSKLLPVALTACLIFAILYKLEDYLNHSKTDDEHLVKPSQQADNKNQARISYDNSKKDNIDQVDDIHKNHDLSWNNLSKYASYGHQIDYNGINQVDDIINEKYCLEGWGGDDFKKQIGNLNLAEGWDKGLSYSCWNWGITEQTMNMDIKNAISLSFFVRGECCEDEENNMNIHFTIDDAFNNRIRKVNTSGIITTFAGNGIEGFSGDGGEATLIGDSTPLWLYENHSETFEIFNVRHDYLIAINNMPYYYEKNDYLNLFTIPYEPYHENKSVDFLNSFLKLKFIASSLLICLFFIILYKIFKYNKK